MSAQKNLCPKCGTPLPGDAPGGLCPECMLRGGFESAGTPESQSDDGTGESTNHLVVPGDEARDGIPENLRFFGDYQLLEEIAAGGMGVIFKARQLSLNRLVAVKMIRAGQLAREQDIRRFRTEAEAAANLKHPNIVAIHEVGEHQGQHYFSMDFIEGRSLADLVRERPLEPARAAGLVKTVAEAMDYAHQRGVLHRDLKPANVMLDAGDQPHVTDFGLAKLIESDSGITQTGALLGSPSYMSPEQARGLADQVGVRSDIYALGAILYELLTMRPPFLAATPLETMLLVAEREPVAPRALNPAVPRDLETICLKCLQKDPAHRYIAAAALAEDLGRWQNHEPIRARPSTVWDHTSKWVKRHPARAGLIALALIAPAAIIAVQIVMSTKVAEQRNVAQAQAEITRLNLYAVDIALAARALEDGDYNLAWNSLAAHRPRGMSNDELRVTNGTPSTIRNSELETRNSRELRGFEWRWLWQRVQGEARASFPAHKSFVNTIAYSPDGRFVASASADGTVRLWDAAQEKLLRTLPAPGNPEPLRAYTDQLEALPRSHARDSASFAADSRTLLTSSGLGLDLWDLEPARLRWSFRTNAVFSALFSPTDPNVALITPHPDIALLRVLDATEGKFTAVFTNSPADAVCFLPDGRRFARYDRNTRAILVQNVFSGEVTASIAPTNIPRFYTEQMAITPDGRTLVVCDHFRGPIRLFDLKSHRPAGELLGHTGRGLALAISPDSRTLASGGTDQTLRLWDLATRTEQRQLHGHRAAVRALAFSPDGQRLASGGHDGTVRFWDVQAPAPPPDLTNVFGGFAFSSDGHWLLTQNRKKSIAMVWELPARRLAQEWQTPPFQSAVFTTNGSLLTASVGSANEPPSVRNVLVAQGSNLLYPRFPIGSASNGPTAGGLGIRDTVPTRVGTLQSEFRGILARCTAIALSPDGQFIVTGHQDGTVAVWETRSGGLIHSAEHALSQSVGYRDRTTTATLNPLVFSANSRTLTAISFDGVEVKTWALPACAPSAVTALERDTKCPSPSRRTDGNWPGAE